MTGNQPLAASSNKVTMAAVLEARAKHIGRARVFAAKVRGSLSPMTRLTMTANDSEPIR